MKIEHSGFYCALGKFLEVSEGPHKPVFTLSDAVALAGGVMVKLAEVEVALRVLQYAPRGRRGTASVPKTSIEVVTRQYLSQDALQVAELMMGFGLRFSHSTRWVRALRMLHACHSPAPVCSFEPLPPEWDCAPKLLVEGRQL